MHSSNLGFQAHSRESHQRSLCVSFPVPIFSFLISLLLCMWPPLLSSILPRLGWHWVQVLPWPPRWFYSTWFFSLHLSVNHLSLTDPPLATFSSAFISTTPTLSTTSFMLMSPKFTLQLLSWVSASHFQLLLGGHMNIHAPPAKLNSASTSCPSCLVLLRMGSVPRRGSSLLSSPSTSLHFQAASTSYLPLSSNPAFPSLVQLLLTLHWLSE